MQKRTRWTSSTRKGKGAEKEAKRVDGTLGGDYEERERAEETGEKYRNHDGKEKRKERVREERERGEGSARPWRTPRQLK